MNIGFVFVIFIITVLIGVFLTFNSVHDLKRFCRRTLSFALAVVLIVGSFSMSAFAADHSGSGVDFDSLSSASDYSRINTLRAYYELLKSVDSLGGNDFIRVVELFFALKDYSECNGFVSTVKSVFCVSDAAPFLDLPEPWHLYRVRGHRFGDSSGSRCVYCGLRYDEFVNLLNDSYVGYTQNGDFTADDPGVVEVQKLSGVQRREYVTVSDGSLFNPLPSGSPSYSYRLSGYGYNTVSDSNSGNVYSFSFVLPVFSSPLTLSSFSVSPVDVSYPFDHFRPTSSFAYPYFTYFLLGISGVYFSSELWFTANNRIEHVPCLIWSGDVLYLGFYDPNNHSASFARSSGNYLPASTFFTAWSASGGSVVRVPLGNISVETSPYSFGKVNQSLSDSGVIQLRNTSTGSVSDHGQINEVSMEFTLPGRNAPVSVSKWGYFYPDAEGNFDDDLLSVMNGRATGAYKLRLSSPITVSNLPYSSGVSTFNATDAMIIYTDSQMAVYYLAASVRDDLGFASGISAGGYEVYDIVLNDDSPLAGDIYNPPSDSSSGLQWVSKPSNFFGSVGFTATFSALASYSGSSDYRLSYAWLVYDDGEWVNAPGSSQSSTYSYQITDENKSQLLQCVVAAFEGDSPLPSAALVSDTVQVVATGEDAGVLATILGRIERILIDIRQTTSDILGRLTGSGGSPGNIDSKDIISDDDSEAAGDGFNLLDLLVSLFKGLWTIVVRLIDFVMGGITSIVDSVTDFGSSLSMFSPASDLNVYDMFAEVE